MGHSVIVCSPLGTSRCYVIRMRSPLTLTSNTGGYENFSIFGQYVAVSWKQRDKGIGL